MLRTDRREKTDPMKVGMRRQTRHGIPINNELTFPSAHSSEVGDLTKRDWLFTQAEQPLWTCRWSSFP